MKKTTENKKSKKSRKKSNRNNFNFKYNKKILIRSLIGLSIILISIIFFRNSYISENIEKPVTTELFLGSENLICKEFSDDILFTSGYTFLPEGSESFQTWIPENNCSEAGGTNCFLQNMSVKARVINANPAEGNNNRNAYMQISNPDESICSNPEKGIYSNYLAYESINDSEGQISGWYCGEKLEENSICGIQLSDKFNEKTNCYGIKAYASQYLIVDAVKIKYSWCWKKEN